MKTILHAIDDPDNSAAALRYAYHLRRASEEGLFLLFVFLLIPLYCPDFRIFG